MNTRLAHKRELSRQIKEAIEASPIDSLNVDIDEQRPYVSITYGAQTLCFIQGEEAEHFIKEIEDLFDEAEFIAMWEAELYMALPFLDQIEEQA